MSWITFIWSLNAGICLTLGGVHFLIWCSRRDQWANLVFSFSAVAAAGYAVIDMVALRDQTPVEYGELWRWALLLGMMEGVLIVWFVRLYLRAGRLWLLWLICGLRVLMVALNFMPGSNFYFREITWLQQTPLLGELISRPHGVLHPWVMLMPLSFLLIILFTIDAARSAYKRTGRPRAWVLGGLLAVGFSLALVSYALYARGILPSTFSSQLFLLLILLMGYELSVDVLQAGRLSRELLESQRRMRLAASAADLGLWEWDTIRDEIWATEKGRERAGVGASERIDFERFLQSLHPDDREPTRRTVRHAMEAGDEFVAEYRVMAPDGSVRWVAARGQVERDATGKPLRMRGVSVDVTERKRTEAELLRLQGELAHVSRVSTMGQLASSLAHELNQPLGAILRNAEAAELFLRHEPPDLDEVRAILDDIRKDDQRASAVIDRMRALIRRHNFQTQALDVGEFVGDVAALARPDAAVHHLKLKVEVPPGLRRVRGDRVQLQQVLLNLIINGMDAINGSAGGDRCITVRARPDGVQAVEIAVSDSGPGIPDGQLGRVFEPFFTSKPNGLGMGLAISRTIIEAHGGRLWAENNDGRGATFRFTLPVAAGAAAS